MIKRRIFKLNNTEYDEYFVLDIDEDYVEIRKFLYGELIDKQQIRIDFLEEAFPDYRDYSFEYLLALTPYSSIRVKSNSDFVQEALANYWNMFFRNVQDIINKSTEINEKIEFSKIFKIINWLDEEDYERYKTKMFVPFLNGLVVIEIFDIDIDTAEKEYIWLREHFNKSLRMNILEQLAKNYNEFYKDEIIEGNNRIENRLMKIRNPNINKAEDIEEYFTPKWLLILGNKKFTINCNCDWDDEHGITIEIKNLDSIYIC